MVGTLISIHSRFSREAVRRLISRPFSSAPEDLYGQSQRHSDVHIGSKNYRLEIIKSAGLAQLHNQTQDLISRTHEPLLFNDRDEDGVKPVSIPQKQEAARLELESTIVEALAAYSSKHDTFSIRGD